MTALVSAIILTFHVIGTEQSIFCLKQMYCTLFTLFADIFYFLWLGYTKLNPRNTGKCKYIGTWPCAKFKSSTNIKEVNWNEKNVLSLYNIQYPFEPHRWEEGYEGFTLSELEKMSHQALLSFSQDSHWKSKTFLSLVYFLYFFIFQRSMDSNHLSIFTFLF